MRAAVTSSVQRWRDSTGIQNRKDYWHEE